MSQRQMATRQPLERDDDVHQSVGQIVFIAVVLLCACLAMLAIGGIGGALVTR